MRTPESNDMFGMMYKYMHCIFSPQALHYLVLISEVDEVEIFKICLEYWNALSSDLYRESPYMSSASGLPIMDLPNNKSHTMDEAVARRQFYAPVLTKVRIIVIYFMFEQVPVGVRHQSVEYS
jgi:Importin beta-related nuclear transport receptor